jgi:hypothetical protein
VVLSTYPQNAFIVEQKPYILSVDSNRNAVFTIPYSLKWNYNYIVSMNEAMELIKDKVDLYTWINLAPSNVVIIAKDPKDWLIGKRNVYKFNDIPMLDKIKNSMRGENETRILLEITDNSGKLLYHTCYVPDSINGKKPSFYGIGEPRVLTIFGNQSETGTLIATIDTAHNYVVQRASKIEVSVVPDKKCYW